MPFTPEQTKLLSAKLDPAHIKPPKDYGPKGDYIEGWHAIAEANRIFAFDGWSYTVREIKCVSERDRPIGKQQKPGFGVTYTALVRTVIGQSEREDVGAGHGYDVDCGLAHESAIKEAVTDALKRALRTFGNQFGLALYDKSRENVGEPEPVATLPKKDARAVYSALSLGLKQCGTVEDLAAFWRDKQADIAALPPDWRQNLTTEKDDLKGLFAARREAAE
jgi:DNA repair and recombination protein RAD52